MNVDMCTLLVAPAAMNAFASYATTGAPRRHLRRRTPRFVASLLNCGWLCTSSFLQIPTLQTILHCCMLGCSGLGSIHNTSASTPTCAFGGSAYGDAMQVVLRKESEWMARQPKARGTKSKARVEAFGELTAKARSGPKRDLQVDFGNVQMVRQGSKVLIMKARSWGIFPPHLFSITWCLRYSLCLLLAGCWHLVLNATHAC
jgi:hypothetical protein